MPASRSRPRSSRHTRCCSASSASARDLDLGQLLRRRAAVRRDGGDAGLRLADQAGDAHRVELVEVGRADRDEAQPLQQRMARVLRLLHHAVVEVEPGQFAVDEAVGAVRRDRAAAAASRRVGGREGRRAVCRRMAALGVAMSWRDPTAGGRARPARAAAIVPEISSGDSRSAEHGGRERRGDAAGRWRAPRDPAGPPPRAARPACAAGAAAASPAPRPATASCRSASSRASSARSRSSSAGPISTAVMARSRLARSGSADRPARGRRAAGEQHRLARLGGGVQQMEQRMLRPRRRRRPARSAAPPAALPAVVPAGRRARTAGRRRCVPPRGAGDASCRIPPRPTAQAGAAARCRCARARPAHRRWRVPQADQPLRTRVCARTAAPTGASAVRQRTARTPRESAMTRGDTPTARAAHRNRTRNLPTVRRETLTPDCLSGT